MPISVQPSDIVARNSYFIIADVTGKPCFHDTYNIWPGFSQVSLSSSILGNRLRALKYKMFKFEMLLQVESEPTTLPCFMLPPGLAVPKKNDLWIQGWSGETLG